MTPSSEERLPSSCLTDEQTPARVLDADERARATRELTELTSGFALLAEQLHTKGVLPPMLAEPVLKLAEARLVTLARFAGVSIDSEAEREERYAMLRTANLRVRELEARLGERAGDADTVLGLRRLGQKIRHWWRTEGLGHVTEMSFGEHGELRVTLGCHLFGNFRLLDSSTPVSDVERKKAWLAKLREQGFELMQEGFGANDWRVWDTERSRKALLALLERALPGARVLDVLTTRLPQGGVVIEDLVVQVRDLACVHALPLPATPRASS